MSFSPAASNWACGGCSCGGQGFEVGLNACLYPDPLLITAAPEDDYVVVLQVCPVVHSYHCC